MALADLLKKAADLKKAAEKELDKGRELVKTAIKDYQEKSAPETIVSENELKQHPECDKGECYWMGTALFCFGCDNIPCEKRKTFKGDKIYTTNDLDMLPVFKKFVKANYYGKHGVYDKDFIKERQIYNEASCEYIEKFLPSFKGHESIIKEYFRDKEFACEGMGKLIDELNRFDISEFSDIEEKLYIICHYGIGTEDGRHYGFISPEDEWLIDRSLFNRDLIDFEFTLTVVATVNTILDFNIKKFYKDNTNIKVEDLYNENGELKPVGSIDMGKDSLLGLVESWKTTADGQDNTADRDFVELYYQMLDHKLPTAREINNKIWAEASAEYNKSFKEKEEERQRKEKMEREQREHENAIWREKMQQNQEQRRQAAEASSQEAKAHRQALNRCSKCKKRFSCGSSRGIPNCGAFDPE